MKQSLILIAVMALTGCVTGKSRPGEDGGNSGQKDGGNNTNKDTGGNKKDTGGSKKDTGGNPGKVPGTWITVQPDAFWMGKLDKEICSYGSSERRHKVTLTRKFELSKFEVTQTQFSNVMKYNPSDFSGTDKTKGSTYCGQKSCGNNPVDSVSWHEAAAYCNALSKMAGRKACYDCTGSGRAVTCVTAGAWIMGKKIYDCPGYRLPTDAEWEFAYRATTTTALYSGDITDTNHCWNCKLNQYAAAIGWYCGNAENDGKANSTHPVGGKMENKWGFEDMAGNLQEWIDDWFAQDLTDQAVTAPSITDSKSGTKVIRGGSYYQSPSEMRAARRQGTGPKYTIKRIGFRPARSLF